MDDQPITNMIERNAKEQADQPRTPIWHQIWHGDGSGYYRNWQALGDVLRVGLFLAACYGLNQFLFGGTTLCCDSSSVISLF